MNAPHLIRSRDNALVKQLTALGRSGRERRADGLTLIDGAHLVAAYADSGAAVDTLAISESALGHPEIGALADRVNARRRVTLTDSVFAAVAPVASPSGIIASIPIPSASALPAHIRDAVVLHRIQEPGNAGAMLRTARAAGIGLVLTTADTVDLWAPKVLRGAMGAHFHLAVYQGISLEAVADRARGAIAATTLAATTDLYAADLTGPIVWLFGHEGAGLDPTACGAATLDLRIPIAPEIESLNVAAAAAICLFEQVRQRRSHAAPQVG